MTETVDTWPDLALANWENEGGHFLGAVLARGRTWTRQLR